MAIYKLHLVVDEIDALTFWKDDVAYKLVPTNTLSEICTCLYHALLAICGFVKAIASTFDNPAIKAIILNNDFFAKAQRI
mgnify:CR=1 FL=1